MELTLKIEYYEDGKLVDAANPSSKKLIHIVTDIVDRELNKKQCEDIAKKYCMHFKLPPVEIVFSDNCTSTEYKHKPAGLYIYYDPYIHPACLCNTFRIELYKETQGQTLGVLLHELSHHLALQQYKSFRESNHGYSFNLARNRTRTWSKKVFGERVNFL